MCPLLSMVSAHRYTANRNIYDPSNTHQSSFPHTLTHRQFLCKKHKHIHRQEREEWLHTRRQITREEEREHAQTDINAKRETAQTASREKSLFHHELNQL